ncbi:ATP-binding protein [Actinospica robiniae]|uniref:ATP-binding protein n=1 Tax=Actinospica robiniae TaxID=304901 RepID=UPI0004193B24|nr:ATP-binding protein [Actinospica robiniae]
MYPRRPSTPTTGEPTEAMFPSPFSEPGAPPAPGAFPEPGAFPDPGVEPLLRLAFAEADLPALRDRVSRSAAGAGLDRERLFDFVLAAHELAANSVMHAGGAGMLRLWATSGELVCEVSDDGVLPDPEVGSRQPNLSGSGGAGLWIVRQACDAVQIRSVPGEGTTVRMLMMLASRPVRDPVGP